MMKRTVYLLCETCGDKRMPSPQSQFSDVDGWVTLHSRGHGEPEFGTGITFMETWSQE